ncbi:minor coat protein pIII [Vibrio cholerae]|uniref:minor coat protein pIII n=2 Tax=Vibrio cholerae TaxID=666 RepID=UPI001C665993|nr:minor coat protein pIII [Vibrio cholerae]
MRYFLLFLTLLFLSPSVTASSINCDPNTTTSHQLLFGFGSPIVQSVLFDGCMLDIEKDDYGFVWSCLSNENGDYCKGLYKPRFSQGVSPNWPMCDLSGASAERCIYPYCPEGEECVPLPPSPPSDSPVDGLSSSFKSAFNQVYKNQSEMASTLNHVSGQVSHSQDMVQLNTKFHADRVLESVTAVNNRLGGQMEYLEEIRIDVWDTQREVRKAKDELYSRVAAVSYDVLYSELNVLRAIDELKDSLGGTVVPPNPDQPNPTPPDSSSPNYTGALNTISKKLNTLETISQQLDTMNTALSGRCSNPERCQFPIREAETELETAQQNLKQMINEKITQSALHQFKGSAAVPSFCSYVEAFGYNLCFDFSLFSENLHIIRMIVLAVAYILAAMLILFR